MKKNKLISNILLLAAAALAVMTVYSACDQYVALGAGIDILPPNGEISYPPATENPIRGTFVMKGTAKDDEGIVSIDVVFENDDTKERSRSFAAKPFSQTAGTIHWEIEVHNESFAAENNHPLVKLYPIPDGQYTAIVTLIDKNGKRTVLNQTYKIDNTPPVFILSSPDAIKKKPSDVNPASVDPQPFQFGADLRIRGNTGEMHSLKSIRLKAGKNSNHTVEISKDTKEPRINVVMTSHGNIPYDTLKGLQSPDANYAESELYLTDNAYAYKGGAVDQTGNETEFYYMYNEIFDPLISKGYTENVISDYFSGKKGNSGGTEHERLIAELREDTDARKALWDNRIWCSKDLARFNLDPDKSPVFSVVGYPSVTEETQVIEYPFGTGTSFTFELNPNKDNTPIAINTSVAELKKQEIKIALYRLNRGSFVDLKKDPAELDTMTAGSDPSITKITLIDFTTSVGSSSAAVTSVSTGSDASMIKIVKDLPDPNGMKSGLYRIVVTGKDIKNNDFTAKKRSGCIDPAYVIVRLESSLAPPSVVGEVLANRYVKPDKLSGLQLFANVTNFPNNPIDGSIKFYAYTGYNPNTKAYASNSTGNPQNTELDSSVGDKRRVRADMSKITNFNFLSFQQGLNICEIKAEHPITGKSSTGYIEFVIDNTAPPPVTVSAPAAGIDVFHERSFVFKGTVSDTTIPNLTTEPNEGSGIAKVVYKVTDSSAEPAFDEAVKNAALEKSGSTYKWDANISFLQTSNIYVHIWAVDFAGNRSHKSLGPFTVNTSAPSISEVKIKPSGMDEKILTPGFSYVLNDNNKGAVTFEIKATALPGRKISSVELIKKTGGSPEPSISASLPASGSSDPWTLTVDFSNDLTNDGDRREIEILVTDTPENSEENPTAPKTASFTGALFLDKTAPAVTFTSPRLDSGNSYSASDINKVLTISGSTEDNREVQKISIRRADGSVWEAGSISASTGDSAVSTVFSENKVYTWSFKLDTTKYPDNTPLGLKAVVVDKAGNVTERPFVLNIKQDADRPVIRVNSFTSIENLPSLTGSRVLSGTVTDDDGNLKNLASDLQIKVGTGSYVNVESSAGGAMWTYDIPGNIPDGDISLDFQVKDAEEAIFKTGTGDALNRPKVVGKDDDLSKARDANITFKLDTKKPEFKSQAHSFVLGSSFPAGNGTPFGANAVIGNKNNKTASFRVWVKDDMPNGIESVTLSIGSEPAKIGTANPGENQLGFEAWDITDVTLPDTAEGNPDITIIAKDKSGFTNEISVPVIIDFTAPVIEHQSPSLDGIYFNEVNLSGIITDTASNNGRASGVATDTIEYKIGRPDSVYTYGTSHNHGGQELSSLVRTSSSWTVKIPDISKYKGLESVIGPSGSSSIHILPITVRGKDNAGNAGTEQTYNIKFDPNGGTPTITVVSPKKVMKAGVETGESIGGDVVISGSAAVANPASGKFVTEITLQLSLDPGSFGSTWSINGKNYGTGYVIETNPAGIHYWNHTLTQAERTRILAGADSKIVYLRVRGKNNDGIDGDWSTERKFTISTDVAEFYEIKLKKGTETTSSDYAPNSLWLTGDSYKITGKVRHNSGIKNDIHAASESLPSGVQSLNRSGTLIIPGSITSENSAGILSGLSLLQSLNPAEGKGYSFTVPIKTNGYEQKSGFIEFDITATDGRTQDYQTVKSKIMLKYDNSRPAAVFGKAAGKFNKASFTNTFASGVSVNLEGTETVQQAVERLKKNLSNLVLFAETKDGSAKAVRVTNLTAQGSYARAEFAATTEFAPSADCILLEQNPIVFDRTSADYQLQGFAYDTGSKTKTVKIEFSGTDKGSITRFDPESGNFVSFIQAVKTNTLTDGQHSLKLTPADEAGNTGDVYSCDVFVRNKPLRIASVGFSTDLDGNGSYTNNSATGLVETVTNDGDGSLDSVQNYSQTLDITKEFTLKKADKSQIKFVLDGGQGTTRNFTLYKVAAASADPWALGTAVKTGSLTAGAIDFASADFAAGQIPEGDGQKFVIVLTDTASQSDTGRKLTLKVKFNVKTSDTRKPSVFVAPFYWNGESDNSLASNDRTKGHIEIKKVSSGTGESDVSGSVVLRGTAYHPTKLTKLTLTVDGSSKTENYISGIWKSEPENGLIVKDTRLDVNGHWVKWEYNWTTGTPGNNKQISVKAYHSDSVESGAAAAPMDFETAKTAQKRTTQSLTLAAGDTAVPGQFIRIVGKAGSADVDASYLVVISAVNGSVVEWKGTLLPPVAASGDTFMSYYLYPVGYTGDEPAFNKPAMSVNVVPYITEVKTSLSSGANPSVFNRTALGNYPVYENEVITVKGFNLDTSGAQSITPTAVTSGELNITVGGISSINNKTDNKKLYNQKPNGLNNDNLTDDVKLDVWQFNSEAVQPANGHINDAVMKINPVEGFLGFAFANGADLFSMPSSDKSYIKRQRNWDDYGSVGLAYGSDGTAHAVAAARDTNLNNYFNSNTNDVAGPFTYFSTQISAASATGAGEGYSGTGGRRLESLGVVFPNAPMVTVGGITKKSPTINKNRIQSPSFAVSKTGVYLAYYDEITDQIRFRHKAQLKDGVGVRPTAPDDPAADHSLIAGGSTGNTAGPFVSIAVKSGDTEDDDVVVAVWYTGTDLVYAYKTKPANDTDAISSAPENPATGNWSKPVTIFENAGEYCQIAVDKAGGIHIAAYHGTKAALLYAFMSSYTKAAEVQKCTVDSYGIVGTNITLDVAYSDSAADGKPVPYIGYYADFAVRPKLAYLVIPATGFSHAPEGADENGKMSGKWEISFVPTKNRTFSNRINVGVWKTDGVIKDSTNTAGSSNSTEGTVYGNGTKNAVLAYIIRNGKIETAQKK